MTKAELIEKVYEKSGGDVTKKLVGELIDSVFDNIQKGIKKEKRFSYPGFGTWTLKNRKARKGRNPQTGEQIKIKASKTVTFRPAQALKSSL